MSNNDFDTTEKVERTDTGYRLTVDSCRGTGTRDQDTVKLEARTETLEELIMERNVVVEAVESIMEERRAHQPDEVDDE